MAKKLASDHIILFLLRCLTANSISEQLSNKNEKVNNKIPYYEPTMVLNFRKLSTVEAYFVPPYIINHFYHTLFFLYSSLK